MSTPFHKKLRIFLEELDKIIEKYEISSNCNYPHRPIKYILFEYNNWIY